MFKIETHLHTQYSSCCGQLDAKAIVSGYLAAGYSGLIVTDHLNRETFAAKGIDLLNPPAFKDIRDAFLEGYHRVKEEGERQGLVVYKGAELRFDENGNDYLIYGYPDSLLDEANLVFQSGLNQFYHRFRTNKMLIVQAHPFRGGCSPADPRSLDGIEVQNMHSTHNSRNDLAWEFAMQNPGLIRTSGSDCHSIHDIGRGGILVESLPKNEEELIDILIDHKFSIINAAY